MYQRLLEAKSNTMYMYTFSIKKWFYTIIAHYVMAFVIFKEGQSDICSMTFQPHNDKTTAIYQDR